MSHMTTEVKEIWFRTQKHIDVIPVLREEDNTPIMEPSFKTYISALFKR